MPLHGPAYDCCSACSPRILEAYARDRSGFVKKALDEQGFVEEVSGLAEVQRRAEEAAREFELQEEEDGEVGEIGDDGELI